MSLSQIYSGHTRHPLRASGGEMEVRSGTRFIPIRICGGQTYLDTNWVVDTPEEAVAGARHSDLRELGPEWAEENRLVGVAEVSVEIVGLRPLQIAGPAGEWHTQ